MNTRNKLIPGNIKNIGVPTALHARLKAEAKASHAAIFEIIADALEARDRLAQIEAANGEVHAHDTLN